MEDQTSTALPGPNLSPRCGTADRGGLPLLFSEFGSPCDTSGHESCCKSAEMDRCGGGTEEWGVDTCMDCMPEGSLGKQALTDQTEKKSAKRNPRKNLSEFIKSNDLYEKLDMLKHIEDDSTCFTTELMQMQASTWYEDLHHKLGELELTELTAPHVGDKVKQDALVPYLENISTFRDSLVNSNFQKASGIMENLINDKDLQKQRKDVLESLYRISQKTFLGIASYNQPKELKNLQDQLFQELKKEQIKEGTIDEAFQQENWLAMKILFQARKHQLSKWQLNQVILLAAQQSSWPEFWECVKLGADLVRPGIPSSAHALYDGKCSTSGDDTDDNDGPPKPKRMKKHVHHSELSPLHEAMKTGVFQLKTLESKFQVDREIVNEVDVLGDSLLHLAVQFGHSEIQVANVKFLMMFKADINATDARGKTPLQYLLHVRYQRWEADLIVELVSQTQHVAKQSWRAGKQQWTALHVLCDSGLYDHIDDFIQKGANPRDVRQGLTLIDTVILQECLHWELKKKIVAKLLKEPIKLGRFHAQAVQKRLKNPKLREYQNYLTCREKYIYPVDRLLFPLISTSTIRHTYKEMVLMLVDGEAVCEQELRHMQFQLHLLEDDPVFMKRLKTSLEEKRKGSNAPWATWWDYEGVAGPQHWGIINPNWRMCRTGKFQSPIDIRPHSLLFDPNLRRMNVNLPENLGGTLVNTGNDLTLRLSTNWSLMSNFSDGPLMYTYRVTQLKLHFGKTDTEGSEHSVDGNSFAAELQFVAYNTDLYKNLTDAMQAPYGIAIIAVFAEASDEENAGFRSLVDHAKQVPWQGQTKEVKGLGVKSLLPDTNYYLTYEGSLTQPACHETVTWVLFNKPIYVSRTQLDTLRQFQKRLYGEESVTQLAGNRRPVMPLNNRAVRTNINYPTTGDLCNMKKIVFYQVNPSLTV